MHDFAEHLSYFRNELNIFKNTGAQMLYSIKTTLKSRFGVNTLRFCHIYSTLL